MHPATGRPQRAIIFGLLDDRSRIIPYPEAGFGETGFCFLTVLYNAIAEERFHAACFWIIMAVSPATTCVFYLPNLTFTLCIAVPETAPARERLKDIGGC